MASSNFFCWALRYGKMSAIAWYRTMVPFFHMKEQGLCEVYEDNNDGDPKLSNIALLHSDIGHFGALVGEETLHRLRSLKKVKQAHRQTAEGGVDIFPPALIWDTDDNTDFVHPFNQTFSHMGVREYPTGKLLKPGDGLEVTNAEGKTIGGWVDGVTRDNEKGITFDIARNLHDMKVRHEIMRTVHGVTVTTPMLAKYARDVIGCKNVYVFPNSITPDHYEKIRAVRTDNRVRILWTGGMSHMVDWYPLREAMRTICQKYKDKITIVMFGEYFDWINDMIPASMLEFHPWVEYPAFRLKRGLLNCDINLCPLVNNVFNSCKSAIKFYEASILEDIAEATLAQRGPVFNEIKDGETGLLFDNDEDFVQKLSLIIEDAQLRRRLATNAHKWVVENRTPEKTVPGLFEFYAETRARQKRDLGSPIIQPATHEQIMKVAQPLR